MSFIKRSFWQLRGRPDPRDRVLGLSGEFFCDKDHVERLYLLSQNFNWFVPLQPEAKSAAELAAAPTERDIALREITTFYDSASPQLLYRTSSDGLSFVSVGSGGGGTAIPTVRQTVTVPGGTGQHIVPDRNLGLNILVPTLSDPTTNIDPVSNLADGQECAIYLQGGGAAPTWTTWSSGAPTTLGYYFAPSQVAPTPPASSTQVLELLCKRIGFHITVVTSFIQPL